MLERDLEQRVIDKPGANRDIVTRPVRALDEGGGRRIGEQVRGELRPGIPRVLHAPARLRDVFQRPPHDDFAEWAAGRKPGDEPVQHGIIRHLRERRHNSDSAVKRVSLANE